MGSPTGLFHAFRAKVLGMPVHFTCWHQLCQQVAKSEPNREWGGPANSRAGRLPSPARVVPQVENGASSRTEFEHCRRVSAVVGFMNSCKTDSTGHLPKSNCRSPFEMQRAQGVDVEMLPTVIPNLMRSPERVVVVALSSRMERWRPPKAGRSCSISVVGGHALCNRDLGFTCSGLPNAASGLPST